MSSSFAARLSGLDGLRAIAVLLVVVYHVFPGWVLRGGFIGVDAFFVISGFLITTLLLREHADTGRVALGAFWRRRARRLLPALLLVVTVTATWAWLAGGDLLVGLGRQVLGALTFSYNWLALTDSASYFSTHQPELLRNLWSLAVEEQFYLLWPLLFSALLLLRGRTLRAALALGLAGGSAVWAVTLIGAGASPTRVYFGTDTHAFGLLLGVALAFAGLHRARPAGRAVTVIGAAALAGLVALATLAPTDDAATFPGILVAASLCATVAIAAGAWPGSRFGAAIDAAPLRWIGERSYGIYLWHWPLLVLLPGAAASVAGGMGVLALTLVLAALSFRFVEQPLRRHGLRASVATLATGLRRTPAQRFASLAAFALAIVLVGGTAAAVTTGPRVSSAQTAVEAGQAALDAAMAGQPVSAGNGGSAGGIGAGGGSPEGSADGIEDVAGGSDDATGGEDRAEAHDAERDAEGAQSHADGEPRGVSRPVSSVNRTVLSPMPGRALPTPRISAGSAVFSPSPSPGPRAPTPGGDGRPVPPTEVAIDGARVSAVGDSVMLASAPALLARFPGIQIDAAVSRSMYAGPGILSGLAAAGELRDYVVVGLGTNGPIERETLDELHALAGSDRHLVLVTASAPRDWIPGVNDEIVRFAAEHPGVLLADWNALIAPRLDLLADDEAHPVEAGGEIYADAVVQAISVVEDRHAQARYQCELGIWLLTRVLHP
ncbi:acyltransferase family protein [Microbacterium sp. No. 7]|uniref:acyltransferase family protein n=1 Tax=Microbacterium sp. No. 7 TaxID=1714373 RepID=UPI0006D15636|nr:acyltransferase family protein [Microbacterium sp. No. 7]ALJ19025.1 hypothetical protein AOA12_03510 [Microbacterium sp. No. 7]